MKMRSHARRWLWRAAARGLAAALLFAFFLVFVPVAAIDDPTSLVLLDRRGELLGAIDLQR